MRKCLGRKCGCDRCRRAFRRGRGRLGGPWWKAAQLSIESGFPAGAERSDEDVPDWPAVLPMGIKLVGVLRFAEVDPVGGHDGFRRGDLGKGHCG